MYFYLTIIISTQNNDINCILKHSPKITLGKRFLHNSSDTDNNEKLEIEKKQEYSKSADSHEKIAPEETTGNTEEISRISQKDSLAISDTFDSIIENIEKEYIKTTEKYVNDLIENRVSSNSCANHHSNQEINYFGGDLIENSDFSTDEDALKIFKCNLLFDKKCGCISKNDSNNSQNKKNSSHNMKEEFSVVHLNKTKTVISINTNSKKTRKTFISLQKGLFK